jgi:hypothetical protein
MLHHFLHICYIHPFNDFDLTQRLNLNNKEYIITVVKFLLYTHAYVAKIRDRR